MPSRLPSKPPIAPRPQSAQEGPSAPPTGSRNDEPASRSRPDRVRAPASGSASPSASRATTRVAQAAASASSDARRARARSASVTSAPAPTRCPASVRWPGASAPASSRARTASVAWTATVRPKRASHAAGIGPSFSMVPVASPSAMTAPLGLLSSSRRVSAPSSCASSSTATDTVFEVSPAAKVSVPEVLR